MRPRSCPCARVRNRPDGRRCAVVVALVVTRRCSRPSLLVRVRRASGTYRIGPATTTPVTKAARRGFHPEVLSRVPRRSSTPRLPPARSDVLGGQLGDRHLRHAARAHAPPVLDRRPDPVDGGSLLRGRRHHRLPLPRRGHAHDRAVERRARTAVPLLHRLRPRRALPPAAGGALLPRRRRDGESGGRRQPGASRGRDGARSRRGATQRVDHLRGAPARPPSRRSRTSPSSPKICTKRPTGSARGQPPPGGTPGIAELLLGSARAVPWFDDPDALDRPLTDGGRRGGGVRRWRTHAATRSAGSPRSR